MNPPTFIIGTLREVVSNTVYLVIYKKQDALPVREDDAVPYKAVHIHSEPLSYTSVSGVLQIDRLIQLLTNIDSKPTIWAHDVQWDGKDLPQGIAYFKDFQNHICTRVE